jgi:hypothetical protein
MYILNLELLRPFFFTTTYYTTITHNYLITVLTGIKGFSYQVHNFFIVRLVSFCTYAISMQAKKD